MIPARAREPKRTPCDSMDISEICFSTFSIEELLNYSVMEITEPEFYESEAPVKGGLFDLRMGVSGMENQCETCGESSECPGHIGHIKLNEPVVHYGYLKAIVSVLKSICHRCMRLRRTNDPIIKAKMKEIKRILDPQRRLELMSRLLMTIRKCSLPQEEEDLYDRNYKSCGYICNPSKIEIRNYKICYRNESKQRCFFDRKEIKRLLSGFSKYETECEVLGFTKTKPIDLMIEYLVVPPPQVRPYVLIKSETKCEDDLSVAYRKILKLNQEIISPKITVNDRAVLIDAMERTIASIMMKLRPIKEAQAIGSKNMIKKNVKSIEERLKGKEGRFRQNLLGKRVDFSARTVISPDPNLDLNELGMPEKIAHHLTYPEKVTALNYDRIVDLCLQKKVKLLINPPESSLRNEQTAINVEKIEAATRDEMAIYVNYGMIAERALENGDYVLLNRQPTLHRMSMMAHKVKILPYNTFRINLSVCSPYNADFDGDEMNAHVPQSYESLCELKNISSVENQIVGPKNGTTSMGFTQDSLLGSCLFTSRDTFLREEEVMNILMWATGDNIGTEDIFEKLPSPAIIKPEKLWTGKQIISLILPRELSIHHMKSKDKIENYSNLNESNLFIKNGEILTGALQKEFIGASSSTNNIIHFIWVEKGPQHAHYFINSFQRMVCHWFEGYGFSIGASDTVPDTGLKEYKEKETKEISKIYSEVFNQYRDKKEISLKHLHQQGKKIMDSFEFNVNLQLNNRLSKVQEIIKNTQDSVNNSICRIVEAKSKGSEANLAQILYSVGNQNINGQRCPLGFLKRALPHFCKDDNSPEARGYVSSSFLEGLKPHEFFFHSMAGREGLSDTSVKTSLVGYLQRKIVKSLEDLIIKYDNSVRDSRNNVLQNFYGEDGFSAEFIEKHHCYAAEITKEKFRELFKWSEEDLIKRYKCSLQQIGLIKKEYSKLYQSRKIFIERFCTNIENPNYDYFCPASIDRIIKTIKLKYPQAHNYEKPLNPFEVYLHVEKLIEECVLPPEKYLQHISEDSQEKENEDDEYDSFDEESEEKENSEFQNKYYYEKKKVNFIASFEMFKMHLRFGLSSKKIIKMHKLSKEGFTKLIDELKEKYYKSLVPAGESVGCLAAQSIGEPTTQMTLNTFHLAGVSDRNVTLGLPRIIQLLNCSTTGPKPLLTIFPSKPILFSERSTPQNQQYLVNMIMYELPHRKIGHFVDSTRFMYYPDKRDDELVEENEETKTMETSWVLEMSFEYFKIGTRKLWLSIVGAIEKYSLGKFKLSEASDYIDGAINPENPVIEIRYTHKYSKLDELLSENLKKSKLHFLMTIEDNIKDLKISGIEGIESVKISKRTLQLSESGKSQEYVVFEASGENLKKCLSHPEINKIKTYSSSVQEIFNVLGIEAARQSLINELKEVLKPYGIVINYRHLSVLVDWMCLRGSLTPVNSSGLNKIKTVSTLTKASYEKTIDILFKAAIFSTKDVLKDTSEKIIFGQPTDCGTSHCQLMIDPSKVGKFVSKQDINRKKVVEEVYNFDAFSKTPKLEETMTYDNSFSLSPLNRSAHNTFSLHSPGIGKSPNYTGTSPLLSFSPNYDPNSKNISPLYTVKNEICRTEYSSRSPRLASPNYRNTPSPSYSYNSGKRVQSPNYEGLNSVPEVNYKEEEIHESSFLMGNMNSDEF